MVQMNVLCILLNLVGYCLVASWHPFGGRGPTYRRPKADLPEAEGRLIGGRRPTRRKPKADLLLGCFAGIIC